MPPENSASVASHASAPQASSPQPQKRSLREIYGPTWLLRCSTLPPGLYREVVDRLVRGESVWSVVHWLMTKPNLGGMQGLHEWTLQKYLTELAREVKRQKQENPPRSMAELKSQVIEHSVDHLASPQLLPRRRGNAFQSIKSFVGDRVEKDNRTMWLLGLLEHNYEQLERCRMVEEEYHHDKKLPTQAMCQGRAQIVGKMIEILQELRENDALDLAKARQASGGLSPELASQLDQRLSDAEKKIAGMVKEFSPEQRAIMRSLWRNMKAKAQLNHEPKPVTTDAIPDPQRS